MAITITPKDKSIKVNPKYLRALEATTEKYYKRVQVTATISSPIQDIITGNAEEIVKELAMLNAIYGTLMYKLNVELPKEMRS